MATKNSDNHAPQFVNNVAVTSGQTYISPNFQLGGCVGFTMVVTASNGAAGTVYIDGSNQQNADAAVFQQVATAALAANQIVILGFGPADAPTYLHKVRFRFVPTSSGNVTVDANARVTF